MKKRWVLAGLAFVIGCIGVAGVEAAAVGYNFDVTTFYQFGGCNSAGTICAVPDTGFLTVVNNGASTFTGTLSLSGTSPISGGFCPPTGTVTDSFAGVFAPGASRTFALSTDSSNCGGFNNPNGANFSMVGTVTLGLISEAVSLSVDDKDIHSGVFSTSPCDGISTDAFVLQGGSPTGCDNGDPYEVAQAPGTFQFVVSDHFMCYTVLAAATLPPELVTLKDQFRDATLTRTKAIRLCNPVDKNGETPWAVTSPDHLVTYAITQSVPPKFNGVNGLVVKDQFGTLFIDAVTPNGLLVPTFKSLMSPPPPPTNPAVDHFVCYTVKTTAGQPPFVRVNGVKLVDQFGARTVDLSKPSRLCNPVNKNGGEPGAETQPGHLMCYETQRSEGQPYFTDVSPIFVNNQFGPQQLKAITPTELCVPALKTGP